MISIIIPCFNSERTLVSTIQSLQSQSYKDWKCVIVDDGSQDASIDLCQRLSANDPRVAFYKRNREPKGAQVCRNIGVFDYCETDFLMFLDSDDMLMSDCLKNRISTLDQDKDVNVFLESAIKSRREYLNDFYRLNLPWNIMAPVWKKSAFEETGGFDENFTLFQDPEVHTKLLERNDLKVSFHRISNPDTIYTNENVNKGRNHLHAAKLILNIERYFFDEMQTPRQTRKAGLKSFYLLLLDYYQMFRNVEEIAVVFDRHRERIKNIVPLLVFNYYTRFPRIRGVGRLLKFYEKNLQLAKL